MSACISGRGEYSDHSTEEGQFICDLCGVFNEDGALAEIERLRETVARIQALGEGWIGFDDSHHYGDAVLGLLAADDTQDPS